MPGGKRVAKKRGMRKYKGRYAKKYAPKRGLRMTNEFADVVQNIDVNVMKGPNGVVPLACGQINGYFNFSLSSCDRAVQVARAYQLYRIKKIEVIVRPLFDTWMVPGALPSGTIPYLYYLIDKGYNTTSALTTFNSMRDAGCKPIRLDDRSIKISFSPCVATAVYDSGVNPSNALQGYYGKPVKSPWLQTNINAGVTGSGSPFAEWAPSSVDHRGIVIGAEQLIQGANNYAQYSMTFKVHFQFKKPNTAINSTGDSVFAEQDLEENLEVLP